MKRYLSAVLAAVLLMFCTACGAAVPPVTTGSLHSQLVPITPAWIDELSGEEPVSRREVMELILRVIGAEAGELSVSAVDNELVYHFTFDDAALEQAATRLETAQMAARALKLLPIVGESPYSDCGDGYVVKLREKGIWGEGDTFRPEDAVRMNELADLLREMDRANLAVSAFRYAGYWVEELEGVSLNEYELTSFSLREDGVFYEDENYTVLRGIDVSEFQRTIDWEAVKADGIDFAIIRAGGRLMQSGGLYADKCFEDNVRGALAAGLQVGVYFFSQAISAEEGLEEAEMVLSMLEGYDITMPVVMDWERLGGSDVRTYGVGADRVTAAAIAFCDRVREAGYTPMIYMNSYCGYTKLDLRDLTDVELWFAEYDSVPTFRYHFTMWQYSAQGRVAGINGNVDMNLYFVPREK